MKASPPARAFYLGLALTVGQTLFVCCTTDAPTPSAAYLSLFHWDAIWYGHIAEHGYRTTLPPSKDLDQSNAAFFPGFPLWARAVKTVLRLPAPHATLLASQLACWGFWVYLFRFLQRWHVSPPAAAGAVLAVLAHPAAFYLVVGYSESLFLFALLGFLAEAERPGTGAALRAAVHGAVLTATRILGLPLALYPVVHVLATARRGPPPGLLRAALVGAMALLGGLSYFAYCQGRFGRWDLYLQAQAAGWGVEPDYLVFLRPDSYRVAWPVTAGQLDPDALSRLSIPVMLAAFVGLLAVEWRTARRSPDSGWRERLGLYLAAGTLFYLSACGLKGREMASMIRYTFSVHVLLVLAAVHLLGRAGPLAGRVRALAATALVLAGAGSLALQTVLAARFTHGRWVA